MIAHCVLATKQATVATVRDLWNSPDLTQKQQALQNDLREFYNEFKNDGAWFEQATYGANTYYIFNQIADAVRLNWIENNFPNLFVELYVGNEWGGPLGVTREYDEVGAITYSGTALWLPTGANNGFALLKAALKHSMPVYDNEGNQTGTVPSPEWHFPHWPGGFHGLDKPAWEYAGVTFAQW